MGSQAYLDVSHVNVTSLTKIKMYAAMNLRLPLLTFKYHTFTTRTEQLTKCCEPLQKDEDEVMAL